MDFSNAERDKIMAKDYFEADDFLPQSVQRPFVLVIFGGAGDLAQRKLLPALYNLAADGLVGEDFAVLATARSRRTDEDYRQVVRQAIREHSRQAPRPDVLERLAGRCYYQPAQVGDDRDVAGLAARLAELEEAHRAAEGTRLFYLATPPSSYAAIIRATGCGGLASPGGGSTANSPPSGDRRPTGIVIEKPFGSDLVSASQLNRLLAECFDESRVYRIDHYLGKETVQNILVFRFANAIFELLLNRQCVHDVQITVAEDGGLAGRGEYYDRAGALRDMVQNHLLQLLCLVAMEPPARMDAESIRDEKVKVLKAVGPLNAAMVAAQTIRGQYAGYHKEPGVADGSGTETYVALRLEVRSRRWAGVPFYLRTGKCLAGKVGEIVVTFRREAVPLFGPESCVWRGPNRLTFRLQPAEGISIAFDAKRPGPAMMLRPVKMDFDYERSFEIPSPEAYERLLLHALSAERSLFARADEVEASWKIIDSIRAAWDAAGAGPPLKYAPANWGPDYANRIFADDETSWQTA